MADAQVEQVADVAPKTNGGEQPKEKDYYETERSHVKDKKDDERKKHGDAWKEERGDRGEVGDRERREERQKGRSGPYRGRGNHRGRGHRGDHRGGRGGRDQGTFKSSRDGRSDFQEETSDSHDEIRARVEFYFADHNLPMDKFLLQKTGGSANRPVPLKDLHSFKRMRRFQPYEAVVEAIKGSLVLDLDENEGVTRKVPLGAPYTDDDPEKNDDIHDDVTINRTVAISDFGHADNKSHAKLEELFKDTPGINSIRLRRTTQGKFKDGAYLEFKNDEMAKEFLANPPALQLYNRNLKFMTKSEYREMRRRIYQQKYGDKKDGESKQDDKKEDDAEKPTDKKADAKDVVMSEETASGEQDKKRPREEDEADAGAEAAKKTKTDDGGEAKDEKA